MGSKINFSRMEQDPKALSAQFSAASPFPHIVLDDMLRLDETELASFPSVDWHAWNQLGDRYQIRKFSCNDVDEIPEVWAQIIREAGSPRFLRALQEITGIDKLIPDPYLQGGGLHLSGGGGVLSPHTDFHIYRSLSLYRQLNVLFYLNDGWTEADGGSLCLYGSGQIKQQIVPALGRMVVFRTDDGSVHGFPTAVAEGKWRKSIALYYYTAQESGTYSGDETTYWREHETTHGVVAKARFLLYRLMLNLSRVISIAAHIVNPHQGLPLLKTALENRAREKELRERRK
ncbi:MAG: 2OG-Fe(II) oxygenase [Lysobacter sp.]|jgi:hypothetical protein|nr:2OG-Fe(II) oxygenase [Lysobacter sp.]MDQ3269435.1 2OG-Fe(II) oxygenase [Pseudomonadota bacterium]